MARFRLRQNATDIPLPMGDVLIGRGPECYLRINEPMVSRRHARLRVGPDRVTIEDLGSRNGSWLNGVSVSEATAVVAGDLLTIGTQQFTLEYGDENNARRATLTQGAGVPISASQPAVQSPSGGFSVGPLAGAPSSPGGPAVPGSLGSLGPRARQVSTFPVQAPIPSAVSGSHYSGPTGQRPSAVSGPSQSSLRTPPENSAPQPIYSSGSLSLCAACGTPVGDAAICPRCGATLRGEFIDPVAFPTTTGRGSSDHLLWSLSDKMLAISRVDEAEKMMAPRLQDLLDRAESGEAPDGATVLSTLRRTLRLCSLTRRDAWFEWIFAYARACRYPLPAAFLDELYAQMFTCRPALSVGLSILAYAQVITDEELILRLVALRRLCRE